LTKVFAGSFRNFRKRFANHEAALENLVSINFRIFRNFRRPFLTFDGVGLPGTAGNPGTPVRRARPSAKRGDLEPSKGADMAVIPLPGYEEAIP